MNTSIKVEKFVALKEGKTSSRFNPTVSAPLRWLKDSELGGILGRSEERHEEYGKQALAQLGSLSENSDETVVRMDLLEPHIAVVVGTRGSGKSVTQGVLIEELASSKLAIGTIVIDRCGVYSGLGVANNNTRDQAELEKLRLNPQPLNRVRIFTVGNVKKERIPFKLTTADMKADDWIQFWNIPEEGTQASLVRELINQVRKGYKTTHADSVPATLDFTLSDLKSCLLDSTSILERYKSQTIRSLLQRIDSSDSLNLFAKKGTGIDELSVAGQVSVLNLSDSSIDGICASKIVGIVARKILNTRQDSIRDDVDYIPVTWLVIDEAHLYVGDSAKKSSSIDLVSYCKLGRHPGCGLILGTQQPAAMSQGVLSQADIVIAHQLVLEADIIALKKIIPAHLPHEMFSSSNLLRQLPPGYAVIADKLTQERPVVAKIRPRKTRHDGNSSLPKMLTEFTEPSKLSTPKDKNEPISSKIAEQKKSDVPKNNKPKNLVIKSTQNPETIHIKGRPSVIKSIIKWVWNRVDI